MDLVKELRKNKTADEKESQSKVVKDVKLLLAGEAAEDARIMTHLSENSNYTRIQKKMGRQIQLENLDKQYQDVFHIDQIKALCVKYHLRFLNSRHYTGNIDVMVVQKIRQFTDKHKEIETSEWSLKNDYFIMAPPKMFQLEDRVIVKEVDPVIFYKIDPNHYRLIHKWGNDFSIFRRFLGWKWEKPYNYLNFWTIVGAILGSFAINLFTSLAFSLENPGITVLITVLSAIAFRIMAFSTKSNNGGDIVEDFFTRENWNSTYKLRK